MTDYQVPEHIRNRRRDQRLSEAALAGIGGMQPPRVSIQGNEFTLIDATGNEIPEGPTMQAVIADMSRVMCKMFYGHAWSPDSSSPPICWSTNGVGPSRLAQQPQSPTCAECPNNVIGSATSAISGAAIKACRDEKHLALYLPKHPKMLFRLVVTPGSFKNWSAFSKPFEGQDVDLNDVIVQFGFQPKTNGVLTFQATEYVSPEIARICDDAVAGKETDLLVGRNDVPYTGLATGARPQVAAPVTETVQYPAPAGTMPPHTAGAGLITEAGRQALGGVVQPQKRPRRTKAEMEAERAGLHQEAMKSADKPAPFRPAQGPAFGVSAGVEPDPEIKGMLNSIFKR